MRSIRSSPSGGRYRLLSQPAAGREPAAHERAVLFRGHSVDGILADYPYLEREDILHALRYAAWRAEEREVMLATV
ncbi:MAG TPA: DUF433 domain-containing protein [Acidobacteriaceae bacterium]